MCPLCISTTVTLVANAVAIAGAASTGGVVAFLAHRLNRRNQGESNAEKNRVSR